MSAKLSQKILSLIDPYRKETFDASKLRFDIDVPSGKRASQESMASPNEVGEQARNHSAGGVRTRRFGRTSVALFLSSFSYHLAFLVDVGRRW